MGIVFVVIVLLALISFWFHQSADKSEAEFANRPMVISDPAVDLFKNEKYAIVKLFAFVQGASSRSAFNNEADALVDAVFSTLGLSRSEIVRCIELSMRHNSEREADRMMDSLNEIRDRKYLRSLFQKAMRIANISGEKEVIYAVECMIKELGL